MSKFQVPKELHKNIAVSVNTFWHSVYVLYTLKMKLFIFFFFFSFGLLKPNAFDCIFICFASC